MAVTTSIYNTFKTDLLSKATSWTGDTINCALFSASTFTAADALYNTSGTEVANANGYTTGGQAVGTRTLTGTTTVLAKISAATQWTATGAGFSAVAAKLYSTTNSNHPIAHIDFGGSQTASGGGTFTITWDSTNGVFNLA